MIILTNLSKCFPYIHSNTVVLLAMAFVVGFSVQILCLATPLHIQRQNIRVSDARIRRITSKAEEYFRQGKHFLKRGRREAAREEFDKAIDVVLESGIDVRTNQKLQTYYLELIERIYREEVPLIATKRYGSSSALGFRDQKFEPSPLDELSKLILTPEELNAPTNKEDENKLDSLLNFKISSNAVLGQFVKYHQGRGHRDFEAGLRHSGYYMRTVREIFIEERVPAHIVWLAQVLSGWNIRAVADSGTSGLWQFTEIEGKRWGLRLTDSIDERFDLIRSTRAAAKRLKYLAERCRGNWELAMAAYHAGEDIVDSAISRAETANFWAITLYLPQDTRDFVPIALAAILIADSPDEYGFGEIRSRPPIRFDAISTSNATSLDLIASLTDSSTDFLRQINPHLLIGVTPDGEECVVYVPPGKARQLVQILQNVPPEKRKMARISQSLIYGMNKDQERNRPTAEQALAMEKCKLTVHQTPELRGFRLGMSIRGALSQIPDLYFKATTSSLRSSESASAVATRLGAVTFRIDLNVNHLSESQLGGLPEFENDGIQYVAHVPPAVVERTELFKEATRITLWFLDDYLSIVRVEYEPGTKWKSNEEFVSKLSAKLGVSQNWVDEELGAGKTLACDGFVVTANIDGGVAGPTVVLKQDGKIKTYLDRRIDMIQREDQRKKDAFKP